MSDVPMKTIRAELHALADEFDMPRLHELADLTIRNFNGRVAPRSTPITFKLMREIIDYKFHNPHLTYGQIGARFNVNQGRVSEILTG